MPESILRITGCTATRVHAAHATAARALHEAVGELTPGEIHELTRFLMAPSVLDWFAGRAQLADRLNGPLDQADYEQVFRLYYHTTGAITTVDLPVPTLRIP